jgi:hypothetical protein
MSQTEELRYVKRTYRRKPRVGANVFYGGGSPAFESFTVNIVNAKQIRLQGQRLSSRDFVQPNWGRVQAVASDEYARALLVAYVPVEEEVVDLTTSFAEALLVPHHGSIRTRQEPETSRDRLAIALKKQLEGIVSAFDVASIRAVVVRLSEASDDHARLRVVRQWLDDVENRQQIVEASNEGFTSRGTVLERLEGFVEQIEGSTAFVTLKSEHGEELYGEYPAADLLAKGIQERRCFRCETVELDGQVRVSFEAIPDREAPDEEDAINRRIDKLLVDDELDGDD